MVAQATPQQATYAGDKASVNQREHPAWLFRHCLVDNKGWLTGVATPHGSELVDKQASY